MGDYGILSNVKLLPAIVCLVSASAFAGNPVRLGLGVSPYADTEISTNVQIAVWETDLKRFEFNLAFLATASNNVQVSFGVDEDGDGRLSAHEERLVAGWDCGEWFARASRSSASSAPASSAGQKTLRCVFATHSDGRLKSFSATDGESPLFETFAASPPAGVYDARWNMARLVARGVGDSASRFFAKTTPEGFHFFLK